MDSFVSLQQLVQYILVWVVIISRIGVGILVHRMLGESRLRRKVKVVVVVWGSL